MSAMRHLQQAPAASSARNYGIDALRVVSMLMIVMLHVLSHGGVLDAAAPGSVNYWICWLLEIACACAVNCYALISGYVGVNAKFKLSNLAVLWCRVAFYSVLCMLAVKLISPQTVTLKNMIGAFFPVLSKQYWYFTAYVVVFLLSPVLNLALNKLSQQLMRVILIGILFLFSVAMPFTAFISKDVFVLDNGYSAWWLAVIYLIGGYLRKYGLFGRERLSRAPHCWGLYLSAVVLTFLSKLVIRMATFRFLGDAKGDDIFTSYLSVTMVAAAVFLLLAFGSLHIGKMGVKIISFLSPLAFSVYLLHENIPLKKLLLEGRLAWAAELPVYAMVLLLIGIVLGIYLACAAIDLLRHYLFRALKLKERFEKAEEKLRTKLGY